MPTGIYTRASRPYPTAGKKGERTKEQMLAMNLRRRGWTWEEYHEALERQEGLCAICKLPPSRLHPDHDHETGKPRDLLCRRCNTALGFVEEDPELLSELIAYIERHKT